jgi:seryl-tRNA synthetase
MLDLKFIKDHLEEVKQNVVNRKVDADPQKVADLYDRRNQRIRELDAKRAERNENARNMKGQMSQEERQALIDQGKRLKQEIPRLEDELRDIEEELYTEAGKIPNMSHPEAPVGADEDDNRELHRVGSIPSFSFAARDHVEIGEALDLMDFDTATKVSGTKFYYLRNEGALLEMALTRFAMDRLAQQGYTLTVTPDIARTGIVSGIGFTPRGPESNIYALEGEDACLVGTAEITLGGYYANEILNAEDLPVRLAGLSHCFRREAGAAGKFSKGLYRVHQFTKVEMFVFAAPEQSEELHRELLGIEEEIFQSLEIPYRVVDTCTGELGGPAYRKYDLEAWMPGRGEEGGWGEITSASNCTDYQARRLSIRTKSQDGKQHVHMLNGTAIAVSRAIIALLENHQQADGSVAIPEALRPYTGFDAIRPK